MTGFPFRRMLVLAPVGALVLAARPPHARATLGLPDAIQPPPADTAPLSGSQESTGSHLAARLRSLEHLSFQEDTSYKGQLYTVLRSMSRDAFRTEVFSHGRLVFALSLFEGQITEFLARGAPCEDGVATEDIWVTYPTEFPDGVDDLRLPLDGDVACSIGDCLSTWIGPLSRRPTRFADMISSCQTTSSREIQGRRCDHAEFTDLIPIDLDGKPRTIHNEYDIDAETGDLLLWVTSQQQHGREALVRAHAFGNIRTAPPPADFAWKITPENLRRALPERPQQVEAPTSPGSGVAAPVAPR